MGTPRTLLPRKEFHIARKPPRVYSRFRAPMFHTIPHSIGSSMQTRILFPDFAQAITLDSMPMSGSSPPAVSPTFSCITVNNKADPRRNCNLIALEAFLGRVNPSEFSVVYVRDTDSAASFKDKFLERYPIFPYPVVNSDARNTKYAYSVFMRPLT